MAAPRQAKQSEREKPQAGGKGTGLRIEAVSAPASIKIGLAPVPQAETRAQGQGANEPACPRDAAAPAGRDRSLPGLALAAVFLMAAAAALAYIALPSSPAGAPQAAAEPAQAGDALVARITAGTLAALRAPQAAAPRPAAAAARPSAPAEGAPLYRMVATAAAQGQSHAYIDRMVNTAYAAGEIDVPAGLIGADGQVDTATLLALFTSR